MEPSSSFVEHPEFPYVFLQPRSQKQKTDAMTKRAQESKTKEGRAVAKPRSACLVSRNLLSARQTSSVDSGASCSPEKQELGRNSVLMCGTESKTWQRILKSGKK